MKIVGHRGAGGLAPENTIAGINKALEHGVYAIEFDLRVTQDGVVILHHNRHLTDPGGARHKISGTKYEELKKHDKDLATFEEALEAINQKVHIYIEVKYREKTNPIIKIIKKHLKSGWEEDNLRIASKSQKTLKELHSALPTLRAVVIEPWSGVRATWRARQIGTNHIIMNQRWLWWGFIRSISRNYKLGTYTLNDPKKADRWEKHGLRMVITDYPDRFH
jgi:glycerophosphoryl diester phosphodiesterase